MALTNSFPTGLPTGLSVADTRRIVAGLIVRDTTGAPRLGIIPRHLIPLVTATSSMSYAVGAFEAVTSRTGVGVELVVNDGTTNVPTTAAPAANSRIDVVWVRSRFNTSGDAADLPEFGVTKGTAGSSPVKPVLPLGALELATATVPSAATATNSPGVVITQSYLYTAAAGAAISFRTAAEMTAFSAIAGQQAFVVANSTSYEYTGSGWMVVADLVTTEALHKYYVEARADITPNATAQLAKSTTYVSPFKRRVLIVVNYQWYASQNSAGFDDIRLGPTTNGIVVGDRVRLHNEGTPGGHPNTMTATAVLEAGTNVISVWSSAESTMRSLMYVRINVYAL
ncbi:hypothetical protein [Plantibacter sp. YIM 135249]|uniref:hypothetical protein n=1 Tax=Plantibacter sp. YIM 135249 TaxID=3423918 RepID=UPI003D327A36